MESEQVSLYSPGQSSLHESEGLLLPLFPFPHLTSSLFSTKRWGACLSSVGVFVRPRPLLPIILFDPVFSQGLQEIPTAQLKWTPTQTAATRTPAAATSVARTWAKLSWGCSTPSLAPWWGTPELRARLQPRYSQYFRIVVGDVGSWQTFSLYFFTFRLFECLKCFEPRYSATYSGVHAHHKDTGIVPLRGEGWVGGWVGG